MRFLITRPQPDARELDKKLKEEGHESILNPLIHIELLDFPVLDPQTMQGLIITSKNGLRAFQKSPDFQRFLDIPLYAVGQATANYAKEAGFSNIAVGAGTALEMVDMIIQHSHPDAGKLVHLTGEYDEGELKGALERKGFDVSTEFLYRAVAAKELDPQTISALRDRQIDGVILLSPRTAKIFSELIFRHGLADPIADLLFFCLSSAIAQALSLQTAKNLRIAKRPKIEEILDLIRLETLLN